MSFSIDHVQGLNNNVIIELIKDVSSSNFITPTVKESVLHGRVLTFGNDCNGIDTGDVVLFKKEDICRVKDHVAVQYDKIIAKIVK